MSHLPKDDLDPVVSELMSGLEDGSIVLDRKDDKSSPRSLDAMRNEAQRLLDQNIASISGAVVGSSIIPGATTASVISAKTSLIYNLARIYGFNPSMDESKNIVLSLGGWSTGMIAAEGLSFFPFVGWAIKSGIVLKELHAFGKAAIKYFEDEYKRTS